MILISHYNARLIILLIVIGFFILLVHDSCWSLSHYQHKHRLSNTCEQNQKLIQQQRQQQRQQQHNNSNIVCTSRRKLFNDQMEKISSVTLTSSLIATVAGTTTTTVAIPTKTNALPLFDNSNQNNNNNRKPLEICLITIQRVLYWAEIEAMALRNNDNNNTDQSRRIIIDTYLETRLGAKALLTGKIGGGATGRVYTLASLQLPACLKDLDYYAMKQQKEKKGGGGSSNIKNTVIELRTSFVEGLASIVEFDGLETLIDPSPRSSLTISQYNDSKAIYVRRALEELVIPTGNQLVKVFGPEPLQTAQMYIQQYYSNEIPVKPIVEVQSVINDKVSNELTLQENFNAN